MHLQRIKRASPEARASSPRRALEMQCAPTHTRLSVAGDQLISPRPPTRRPSASFLFRKRPSWTTVAARVEGWIVGTNHPLSDDGRDALTLANELVERYHLTSVSPRFLRIVPSPVVRA